MMTGWPLTTASVSWLPPVEATTRVFPLVEGRGVLCSGRRMINSPFSMVTFIRPPPLLGFPAMLGILGADSLARVTLRAAISSNGLNGGEFDLLDLLADIEAGTLQPPVALERAELLVDLGQLGRRRCRLGQLPDICSGEDLLGLQEELVDAHAGGVGDLGDDLGDLRRLLGGIVPEDVGQHLQVFGLDLASPVEV